MPIHVTSTSRLVRPGLAAVALVALLVAGTADAAAQGRRARLSRDLAERLRAGDQTGTSVIVSGSEARVSRLAARHGLRVKKRLATGAVLEVPAGGLATLAADPEADQISSNSIVVAQMTVTNQSIGADLVQEGWSRAVRGLSGKGIGVAVIDSGVADVPELKGRLLVSRDFTDERSASGDRNGHGTHVAGIIAASPKNRYDAVVGVAPGANIISLKVLDAQGRGVAGDVIEAIDWAVANRQRYNIRIINMSLGGPVTQGWRDDPLCQAVERAYRAGITVVASAGNFGKLEDGRSVWGGITTPGVSPFAITVGALDTKGTPWRSDDEIASYSSKGPTLYDRLVKPDLVAPGHKILSLAAPGSKIVTEHPEVVVSMKGGQRLQLSGTSMAAGVVSGAAALILDRQAGFSPLTVRALLQYSAERSSDGLLRGGTGRLNLAAAMAMPRPESAPQLTGQAQIPSRLLNAALPALAGKIRDNALWGSGKNILWGSRADNILRGNAIDNILWGNAADNILWGNRADNILWGNADNILWGNADNILWGNAIDNILWGNAADNILWGNSADNILWGNADNILWGNANNILWGSSADNILWGNADNILWGNADNILWGSSADNILWGNADNILWGNAADNILWGN